MVEIAGLESGHGAGDGLSSRSLLGINNCVDHDIAQDKRYVVDFYRSIEKMRQLPVDHYIEV